jgi:hypothetical protein
LKSSNSKAATEKPCIKRDDRYFQSSREDTQATLSFPTPFSLEDGASNFFLEDSNTSHFQMV